MFETFFQVRERCPRCNFPIQREEGHWLGAVGINMIVTLGLLFVTMLVAFLLTIEERRAAPDPHPLPPRGRPHAGAVLRELAHALERHRPRHATRSNPATTSTPAGSRPR